MLNIIRTHLSSKKEGGTMALLLRERIISSSPIRTTVDSVSFMETQSWIKWAKVNNINLTNHRGPHYQQHIVIHVLE